MAGRLLVRGGAGIGGVASSGWMGRSYSPGVADLVTVWAGSASIADAAATLIAGKITAFGINIKQARAAELDPTSDLGDMKVTTAVHDLSPSQRKTALDRGAAAAASHVLKRAHSWLLPCSSKATSVYWTLKELCRLRVEVFRPVAEVKYRLEN